MSDAQRNVPVGFCQCGCGRRTKANVKRGGFFTFSQGHNKRQHWTGPEIVEEDRGFDSPCLIWQRGLNANGYGQTTLEGRKMLTHRIAYIKAYGEIPAGLDVHHRCAVNPAHLEALPRALHAQAKEDPRSKLSAEQVREMRLRAAVLTCGRETAAKLIAPDYGVSWWCVVGILRKRHWKNV